MGLVRGVGNRTAIIVHSAIGKMGLGLIDKERWQFRFFSLGAIKGRVFASIWR